MIQVKDLIKNYKSVKVIKGLNLNVEKGEVYGFIGHNGAGKSTVMNILSGLIQYQSGNCLINGKEIKNYRQQIIKDVGYLPEDPKFYPHMTSIEYLKMIGRLNGKSAGEIGKKIDHLLDITSLKYAAKRAIKGYSRGMKQRLGIAVTLFPDPPILLLDEPSSALDPEGRNEIVNIINTLKEKGKTIFLSTHILSDIERICDRIGMLQGGKLILENSFENLIREYLLPVYDIVFSESLPKEYENKYRTCSFVEEIQRSGNTLSVFFTTTDQNKKEIFNITANLGIPVESFTLRKSSLEEIFLRLVNIDE